MKNSNMMKAKKRVGFTVMAAALLLGLPSMAVAAPTAPYGCAKSEHISPAERQSKSLSGYRAPVGSTGIWKILEHEHD